MGTWVRRLGGLAFVASLALVGYATLTPNPASGGTPDWLAHVMLFAAVGGSAVVALADPARPGRGALAALVIAAGLGALTEAAQWPLETRSPAVHDLVADLVGAVLGVALGLGVVRLERD
ncbi:MAG: hypothetical protein AMXMBFR23_23520 [Chloroflexota bacterium]